MKRIWRVFVSRNGTCVGWDGGNGWMWNARFPLRAYGQDGSVFAPLESYRAEDKLTLPGQRT